MTFLKQGEFYFSSVQRQRALDEIADLGYSCF